MSNKKLVLFGAGKIGRSFIGQLFSRAGFEVVFIDIFKPVIDALNLRKSYKVIVKTNVDEVINITNVRGVLVSNEQNVISEIANASIVAVSIGQNGLPAIMPLLAKGLIARYEQNNNLPLDIIIAENLRDAALYFESELSKLLPTYYPFNKLVGLVETSIGKMVPIMLKKDMDEDILQVFAEPYNTLILDKLAFKNPIPQIEGLAPKQNMKAWVDRKLFIHNLGHAATAYIGYVKCPKYKYLYEVLDHAEIFDTVRQTMTQAANLLKAKYPSEFTEAHLNEHITDLLNRFQNKALGDTIFRVGCDLSRKLSTNDRLSGALHLAIELNMPYNHILHAIVCANSFKATNEDGNMLDADMQFHKLYGNNLPNMLLNVCGLNSSIHKNIIDMASEISVNKL